jgi:RNA polymerase sigma-70 factor, ECF subfamily
VSGERKLDPDSAQWLSALRSTGSARELALARLHALLRVFLAIVVDGTPLDALVVQLGSSRNAVYKTMFDARRKLRAALVANGYLAVPAAGPASLDPVRRLS